MKIVQAGDNFDVDETASRRLLDQVLSRPLFAHLATASEQGPRESPVWFLWEEAALWIIGNQRTDIFPKRIEREPRCAIGIVDFDIATGFVQHVGFRGRARLEPHDEERMKRLLRRYLGEQEQRWDPRFLAVLGDRNWVFVRFEPETAVVRDQSYQVNQDGSA
ncbi:MAG: pyridoxamine 5'-phosphate oxidase family protein [Pyrinomonadaceae bacterium]|jgi:nitroimidazol reductase NimA-like FMN-containing flavoprotein (pyridoxamine 5'-phosphate oxidase superfamily)